MSEAAVRSATREVPEGTGAPVTRNAPEGAPVFVDHWSDEEGRQEADRIITEAARRHLTRYNWGSVAITAFGLSGYALSSWGAVVGYWPLWVGYVINSYLGLLLFLPVHEAAHGNITFGRWRFVNRLIGWINATFSLPLRGWGDMHRLHHAYPNNPELDADKWLTSRNPFVFAFKCLTIVPGYFHFWMTRKAYNMLPHGRWALAWSVVHYVAPPVIGLTQILMGWGNEIMALWVFPLYTTTYLVAVIFAWTPHYPHDDEDRYAMGVIHMVHGPKRFLVRLFDVDQFHHSMHHIATRVPFYRLGKLAREVRPQLEKRGMRFIDIP